MTAAELKPGWMMSAKQHRRLFTLWNEVCHTQGWDKLPVKEREAKRHEILRGLGFASAKDIDGVEGFDKVKRHFLLLAGNIPSPRSEDGNRVRLIYKANRCLEDLAQLGYAPAAVNRLLKSRFGVISNVRPIDDLETGELLNLVRTLTNRATTFRQYRALSSVLGKILTACGLARIAPARPTAANVQTTGKPVARSMQDHCRDKNFNAPSVTQTQFCLTG